MAEVICCQTGDGSLASNVAWLRRRLGCGMQLNRFVRRHFVFLKQRVLP